jgi:hypothetical protein
VPNQSSTICFLHSNRFSGRVLKVAPTLSNFGFLNRPIGGMTLLKKLLNLFLLLQFSVQEVI